MCCACKGFEKEVPRPEEKDPDQENGPNFDDCQDSDNGATDKYGADCSV